MRTTSIVIPAVLVLLAGTSLAEDRTWTDSTGQLQVQAEFVAHKPGTVWLRRDDGQLFEIAMSKLSEPDQAFVLELVRRQNARIVTAAADSPGRISYGPGRLLGELAAADISESSGLCCSRRRPGLFWTHNDSGDDARLYLLDAAGRDLGHCSLAETLAYDWEDIVSFESDGKQFLLVCDVGNNGRAAAVQMLHLIEEPKVDPKRGLKEEKLAVVRTIFYSYEDDYRDCEAVAVDPTDKTILFVTRERGVGCRAYALPWPDDVPNKAFPARLIGTLQIPTATGMDISPDGRRAIVSSYGNAYEYLREKDEDWEKALSRPPRLVVLPKREQGESICYGIDGRTLYLTSEKRPAPLWEVPVLEEE